MRTHLVKESRLEKATVNNSGRTAHTNYRLVAVEELDLKESTVDLYMHWASSGASDLLGDSWYRSTQAPSTGNIRLPKKLYL